MSATYAWDPTQYHQFGGLRLRPALDLLARVAVTNPRLVHDIGTGGGEMARLMAERWPDARVVGSDASAEMLEKAAAEPSAVEWQLLDVAEWRPAADHDLIFGNAVLHWLQNHGELFPRLVSGLVSGGELAVQMPMSWWQPSNQVIRQALAELDGPEATRLAADMAVPNVGQAEYYHEVLHQLVTNLDIWETEYLQVLTGDDPVFEWISGAILRPVIASLPAPRLAEFLERCRARLRVAYPRQADGTTLFPFRRLFIVARR